mmetsp:Transcript_12960/g.19746  ORF Transcript_12960/g.19746 Transcript_12960/m.19746 type:complete len:122 (+) Transcript_12960:1502-1867(+)
MHLLLIGKVWLELQFLWTRRTKNLELTPCQPRKYPIFVLDMGAILLSGLNSNFFVSVIAEPTIFKTDSLQTARRCMLFVIITFLKGHYSYHGGPLTRGEPTNYSRDFWGHTAIPPQRKVGL